MAAETLFCAQNTLTKPAEMQRPVCTWPVGPNGRPAPRWTCARQPAR